MKKTSNKKGFTLMELSLSIAFIGILSLTIVMIINNTISTYRRGLILNQLNSTGMELVDDLRAAVQNSSTEPVEELCAKFFAGGSDDGKNCTNQKAQSFVSIIRKANVMVGSEEINNTPVFGAFCTGSYSYIWNSGYYMTTYNTDYSVQGVDFARLKYRDGAGNIQQIPADGDDTPFKILKVEDDERSVCIAATRAASASGGYNVVNENIANIFDISSTDYPVVAEEPIDILAGGANGNMVLYDLMGSTADNDSNTSLFYSVSLILGTIQGGINVMASGNSCATPSDYEVENFDYCSINKFNFAAQANGA